MWLNNIRISEKKALSPVEFLVLANCISEDYQSAPNILHKINNQIDHWQGTPGTIYPILHRLKDLELMDQDKESKLSFKTSKNGTHFFVSTIRAFEDHYDSNRSFFVSIIRSFMRVDPILSKKILDKFKEKSLRFLEIINELDDEADRIKKEENWSEVDVIFED